MSRIGKLPIQIPPKVKVGIQESRVSVEGPKGKLEFALPKRTSAVVEGDHIVVRRDGEDAAAKSLHGLSRAIVNNMVRGVSDGFVKKLEIQGVGFKAAVQGKHVNLSLGYSHPINYPIPDQIKVTVEENTKITIEGPSKEVVGRVAAEIRNFYPPEPYKGKGVRYVGEHVVRKEGKTRPVECCTILRYGEIRDAKKMRPEQKVRLEQLRRWRIRKKVVGSQERPRMSVCFTNKNIYVQFIDDAAGVTLATASTLSKTLADRDKLAANVTSAKRLGQFAAETAKTKGIEKVVFDRGGARYHGKIKALADAAREAGLKF